MDSANISAQIRIKNTLKQSFKDILRVYAAVTSCKNSEKFQVGFSSGPFFPKKPKNKIFPKKKSFRLILSLYATVA